tara:strand:+ start:964 stop:1431 length:468 start_codon:yes stop_codon:yes gene_type:complete
MIGIIKKEMSKQYLKNVPLEKESDFDVNKIKQGRLRATIKYWKEQYEECVNTKWKYYKPVCQVQGQYQGVNKSCTKKGGGCIYKTLYVFLQNWYDDGKFQILGVKELRIKMKKNTGKLKRFKTLLRQAEVIKAASDKSLKDFQKNNFQPFIQLKF